MPAATLNFLRDIPKLRAADGVRRASMLFKWKTTLTNENLGWIVYESEDTFTPVHRVLGDPEYGPVVLIGALIYEVDVEKTDFYPTETAARAAYWKAKEKK